MKRILIPALAAILMTVSCGPSKHAVHVEMRHPSRSGVEVFGKNVSVVYLENNDNTARAFCQSMADGFAYTLEQDMGYPDGTIGIYRMRQQEGADYSSKDSFHSLIRFPMVLQ